MKKATSLVIAVGALALCAVTAQAQNWGLFSTYTDTLVTYHNIGGVLTTNLGANTWNNPAGPGPSFFNITAWGTDGDAAANNGYRLRSPSGGGADRAYNANLYYTSSDGYGSPDGYTVTTGLTPNTLYTIAMYGIIGGSKDTLSYSLNDGGTWSSPIDEPVVNAGIGANWLVHSTTDAFGTPMAARDGDTRFRIIIGEKMSDATGKIVVGFRDPNLRSVGGTSDRGRIDGFAFAEGGLAIVPEPTTFALAGLGAAALLIFRRRQ